MMTYQKLVTTGELENYGGAVVTFRESTGGPAPRKALPTNAGAEPSENPFTKAVVFPDCTPTGCTLRTKHVCAFNPGPDASWEECSSGGCGVCKGCTSRNEDDDVVETTAAPSGNF